jgi:Protein of unknown function (DUF2937)
MVLLRGILDRIILVGVILSAGCIPSFIAQYRQRLGGRLDQVIRDLAPFQEIANRNHGGDLRKLIEYHLKSTDPTFHDEGSAIQAMVDAVARLRAGAEALNTDIWHQLAYLSGNGDADIARKTWDAFVPAFSLTTDYAIFALAVGISIWLVFLGVWIGFARLLTIPSRTHYRGAKR